MVNDQELSAEEKPVITKTILIVEDDTDIGEIFARTIQEGTIHQPILVSSGAEALEVVQDLTPNLFLLDYHLPKMNGLELHDRLHELKGFEEIPTILTSAGVLQYDLQHRQHILGISKPVDMNKLLDLIEEILD